MYKFDNNSILESSIRKESLKKESLSKSNSLDGQNTEINKHF